MRRRTSLLQRAGLALTLAAVTTLGADASAQISPGAVPEFDFTSSLVNGRGTTKLADLQGKLIWVEFWGTY